MQLKINNNNDNKRPLNAEKWSVTWTLNQNFTCLIHLNSILFRPENFDLYIAVYWVLNIKYLSVRSSVCLSGCLSVRLLGNLFRVFRLMYPMSVPTALHHCILHTGLWRWLSAFRFSRFSFRLSGHLLSLWDCPSCSYVSVPILQKEMLRHVLPRHLIGSHVP